MKNTHKYDEIIDRKYPFNDADRIKHPRMPIGDRAKIFASFAALRGYEDAVAVKQKLMTLRHEISEDIY